MHVDTSFLCDRANVTPKDPFTIPETPTSLYTKTLGVTLSHLMTDKNLARVSGVFQLRLAWNGLSKCSA